MSAQKPADLAHAMRWNPAGHGVCPCKGASCYAQAGSTGKIGAIGYEIAGRIVCAACAGRWAVMKMTKEKTK